MTDLLLPLWVALIGADRIDLLGGHGPIVLTPFYVLTPLVIGREAVRRSKSGGRLLPEVPARGAAYAALLLTLIAVAGLSILNSRDVTTSVGRVTLLLAMATGTGLVLWSLWDDPTWHDRLARGARWGVALAGVMSLLQIAEFVHWLPAEWMVGPVRLRLDPFTYAGILPRPAGLTFDPNRAGLVTLLHWALLDRAPQRPHRAWSLVTGALLVATLSRSSLLAVGAYLAAAAWERRVVHVSRPVHIGRPLALLAAGLALLLLLAPRSRERLGRFLAPVAERLNAAEGSAQAHGSLVTQGVREATRDVPRTLRGVGYGTSFLLLRDRFGGDRYGNFHSLYVTLWVESGIVALLLLLCLLLRPLQRPSAWRGLLVGAILFNVFYQASGEAAFWTVLTLAWSAPPPSV